MHVKDLQEILDIAEMPSSYYSLMGERHEALCIRPQGQVWHVFESDRGRHYKEETFLTEDEACTRFLKRIFEVWHG